MAAMTAKDYRAAIEQLGLSQERAGLFFGVSPRTGQRYASEGPPKVVAMLLRIMLEYKISVQRAEVVGRV